MNLSKQIKKYRERDGYSQEYLAEKLYVSRQSISNWENDKSLPDIHNLLMMCELFNVTLDDLVKGTIPFVPDIKVQRSLNLWTYVMLIFMTLAAILMGPLVVLLELDLGYNGGNHFGNRFLCIYENRRFKKSA